MAPELPFAIQPSNFDMHLARIFESSRNQKIIKSVGLEQQDTAYTLNKGAICTFYSLGQKTFSQRDKTKPGRNKIRVLPEDVSALSNCFLQN